MKKNNFKRVSLIIGSYVCPDTPEAIERTKDALIEDLSTAIKHWDANNLLVVEDETDKDAEAEVPDWLWEDLEELKNEEL